MHVLEAGDPDQPLILLLHGFPELAFSWRHILVPLANLGFHVVAPDQRGYGRTTGWDSRYEADLSAFCMLNLVRDVLALVAALGYREAAAVVGHDFGSPVAAWCALARPDVFRSVVLMSAPFAGPVLFADAESFASAEAGPASAARSEAPHPVDVHAALAALDPPRRHYQWYYATDHADRDMRQCAQGVPDFLRAYYHCKSADWPHNQPAPLSAWNAEQLARLPHYYVMRLDQDMAQTVAPYMPDQDKVTACRWLTDADLAVYVEEFERTGFQGGLHWYRCAIDPARRRELALFSGLRIEVPACFIAGQNDWGVHQTPGALKAMGTRACADLRGVHLLPGAGHWVQQEQPQAVLDRLQAFLLSVPAGDRP